MGASRKLQGEIDRVLKKVNEGVEVFDVIWNKVYDTENANQKEKFEAELKKEIKKLQRYRDQIKAWIQSNEIKDKKVSASYEQALMEARKLIEREMERFKVCEKETKTKAFSKEGLGQQPKTDPKEKAKSETRDWLNNLVTDLESQIDNFEAEAEGLTVKKGKTRPARLTHLETSISRHKAHIVKLEVVLRLLDNDGLSPDQVNDIKDFLEDYVERNQENFDEFDDVDELYSSLPLDQELEELAALGPTLVKAALSATTQKTIVQDQSEEPSPQDANSDFSPRIPTSKSGTMGSLVSAPLSSVGCGTPSGSSSAVTANILVRPLVGGPTAASTISGPVTVQGVVENSAAAVSSSLLNSSNLVKEDDTTFLTRKSSPAIPEIGLGRGIVRGISAQVSVDVPMSLGSVGGIDGNVALGSATPVSDTAKRNMLNVDERVGAGVSQTLVSPLSNRILLQQVSKNNEGTASNDSNNVSEGVVGGRVFPTSFVTGVQWKPQSLSPYQNQNETGQFRGRPEITPDQREKFLERFEQIEQVKQQGHNSVLTVPHLSGANYKQFSPQQQNLSLQQLNSQTPSSSPQVGLGLSGQAQCLASVTSATQQRHNMIHQPTSQQPLIPTESKDADLQQNIHDDLNGEPTSISSTSKIFNDDEPKTPYMVKGTASLSESIQLPRDTDLSLSQPLQMGQSSSSLGVIGRKSVSDLGAIGDNLSGSVGNSGGLHDLIHNSQMLEAAYHQLPQPQDSERAKSYVPRHPAVTPASYPQAPSPIVDNPAFWEQTGLDATGTDTLFFAFYYQQNTYQQYLAAKELKRQSWRYHKKYTTWFQRHEEPKITNDNFERGTYVYFDFHIADDGHGWCQRIKTEFTFEYKYLEDDLVSDLCGGS